MVVKESEDREKRYSFLPSAYSYRAPAMLCVVVTRRLHGSLDK